MAPNSMLFDTEISPASRCEEQVISTHVMNIVYDLLSSHTGEFDFF